MTGAEVPVVWRGRTVPAWLPEPLTARDTDATAVTSVRASERARQAVINADVRTPAEWEPLARLLLRAEGVASSCIEGVRATAPGVAYAVAAQVTQGPAGWVAANLEVIDAALGHAHGSAALTVETLHSWHRRLMSTHSSLPPQLLGSFRDDVGWIGGTSPLDAALVVAPAPDVPALAADLLGYLNLAADDPIAQAAAAHAQFEIIHPYGDGNGRLGRAIILWALARHTGVRVLPPVSTRIARDSGGYLAGLTTFRLQSADPWIHWFADTLTASVATVTSLTDGLGTLLHTWAVRLDQARVRADATARRLLPELPRVPVLTSALGAERAGVSERAARTALATLAEHGVIAPFHPTARPPATAAPGARHRWWYAPEVFGLVTR